MHICTASHLRWTSYIRSATFLHFDDAYSSRAAGKDAARRTLFSRLRSSVTLWRISSVASFTMLMRISSLFLKRLYRLPFRIPAWLMMSRVVVSSYPFSRNSSRDTSVICLRASSRFSSTEGLALTMPSS